MSFAMLDHSVTCHPTQVNTLPLCPSIYLPWKDGRLSWLRWSPLHTEMVYPPTDGHSSKY